MQELDNLEHNINALLNRYSSLQQDYSKLQEEHELQRQEMMRTHSELVELQQMYKALRIAKGLSEDPEQQDIARRHINNIINQIDRVLEILKQ